MKGLHGVVLVLLLQVCDAHHRHGACEVGLALCGVACYHHLFNELGVLAEGHVHLWLGSCGDGVETDVGDYQLGTFLHLQGEVAIEVCHGGVGGALFRYRCSDDGLTIGLLHDTLHLHVLCEGCGAYHCEHGSENDFLKISHSIFTFRFIVFIVFFLCF